MSQKSRVEKDLGDTVRVVENVASNMSIFFCTALYYTFPFTNKTKVGRYQRIVVIVKSRCSIEYWQQHSEKKVGKSKGVISVYSIRPF